MIEPIRETARHAGRGGRKLLALMSVVVFVGVSLCASRSSKSSALVAELKDSTAPTDHAVAAAQSFLDALDAKQRGQALFEFASPRKPHWSNLPVTMVRRNGVRLGDLTAKQRALAMDLVAAVLSKNGYQKIRNIMDADQQLAIRQRQVGRGRNAMFGSDQYYLAIFGKPSETKAWMVQLGGHHLGLNVTVIGKHFVLTPTHTGAQPSLFTRNNRRVRPLGVENDAGFKLVNALDDKQRAQAIISERPQRDLILGPGQDARKPPKPEGIKGAALTRAQQALLVDVIAAWVNIAEPDTAKARMTQIKRTIGQTYFAWKGSTTNGKAAYFRVQGPSIWIEYAPQGSTDHIHTVVRNPKDEYGAAFLGR
jgi:hypothetical protein